MKTAVEQFDWKTSSFTLSSVSKNFEGSSFEPEHPATSSGSSSGSSTSKVPLSTFILTISSKKFEETFNFFEPFGPLLPRVEIGATFFFFFGRFRDFRLKCSDGAGSPWAAFRCALKERFCRKFLMHLGHSKSFGPRWVLRCMLRRLDPPNVFMQKLQL